MEGGIGTRLGLDFLTESHVGHIHRTASIYSTKESAPVQPEGPQFCGGRVATSLIHKSGTTVSTLVFYFSCVFE